MKYILSIDGGGSKILIAGQFLRNMEKEYGSIHKLFDVYAGTSSGCLLLAPIAYYDDSLEFIMDDILKFDNIKKMFTKTFTLYPFYGTKYDGRHKTELINKYGTDLRICDTDKYCLFTAYNIDSVNNEHEKFFKSYDDKLGQKIDTTLLSKIADASTSAPSYFSSTKIDNKYYIDGGLFALNPTDCIYADCLRLFEKEELRILSISLDYGNFEDIGCNSLNWGPIQWVLSGKLIERINKSNVNTVDYKMEVFTKALGHKYIRIKTDEIDNSLKLDSHDKKSYDKCIEIGNKLWSIYKNQIKEFLDPI